MNLICQHNTYGYCVTLGTKGSNCRLGLVLRCDANEMLLKANGKRGMELME